MQTRQIANELRALANNGTRVPLHRGKVMVEVESLMGLSEMVSRLQVSDDAQEASEVIRMKESIVNQAYLEAKRIRANAETEAEQLTAQASAEYESKVGDSAVLRKAEEKAQEMQEQAGYESQQILQDAQRKAYRLTSEAEAAAMARRDGADGYAREVLFNLEEQLADVLGQVRRGIDALNIETDAHKKQRQKQNGAVANGAARQDAVAAGAEIHVANGVHAD